MDRDFNEAEVKKVLMGLGNGKASGWDTIPNEALKNASPELVAKLVTLFNRVKNSGDIPSAWKKGRLVLIHKAG